MNQYLKKKRKKANTVSRTVYTNKKKNLLIVEKGIQITKKKYLIKRSTYNSLWVSVIDIHFQMSAICTQLHKPR